MDGVYKKVTNTTTRLRYSSRRWSANNGTHMSYACQCACVLCTCVSAFIFACDSCKIPARLVTYFNATTVETLTREDGNICKAHKHEQHAALTTNGMHTSYKDMRTHSLHMHMQHTRTRTSYTQQLYMHVHLPLPHQLDMHRH
jgi:hypothetical protein